MDTNLKNIVSGDCVIIALGMNMDTNKPEAVTIAVLKGELKGISPIPEGITADQLLNALGALKALTMRADELGNTLMGKLN